MLEVQGINDGVNDTHNIWFLIRFHYEELIFYICYFSETEIFQNFWT